MQITMVIHPSSSFSDSLAAIDDIDVVISPYLHLHCNRNHNKCDNVGD